MSLPPHLFPWDVSACSVCVSLYIAVTQTGVCLPTAQHVRAACQELPRQCCKMRFWICFAADPAPHLISVTMMNHVGHPGFSLLSHSPQRNNSPWCYTDCFGITSSLCALRLHFWPITILDFMPIVKQIVSITSLFICLPMTCNSEISSEESFCTAQPSCLILVPQGDASYTIK